MIWHELGDTLAALVSALTPEADSGLIVTEVELDVPLEVIGGVEDGKLVFYGNVPHSRWQSGFLPAVHLSRLVVQLAETDPTSSDDVPYAQQSMPPTT